MITEQEVKMGKIRTNLHTHTEFSDGSLFVRDQINSAVNLGFVSLGISDHSYTQFDGIACIQLEGRHDEYDYTATIRRAAEEYRGTLDVFCGIELDSLTPELKCEYDYVIASVHFIKYKGEYYPTGLRQDKFDEIFGGSAEEYAKCYFDEVVRHVSRCRPDIVGHFDLFNKYFVVSDEDERYIQIVREALDEIFKYTGRFEVNTGCMLWREPRVPYPSAFILEEILSRGGSLVISSDCHEPRYLDYAFDEMPEFLKRIGFKTYDRYVGNGRFIQEDL